VGENRAYKTSGPEQKNRGDCDCVLSKAFFFVFETRGEYIDEVTHTHLAGGGAAVELGGQSRDGGAGTEGLHDAFFWRQQSGGAIENEICVPSHIHFLATKKIRLWEFWALFLCLQHRRVVAPECSGEVREREREGGVVGRINVEETRGMKGGCDVGDEED
jgi:hypothetical protein